MRLDTPPDSPGVEAEFEEDEAVLDEELEYLGPLDELSSDYDSDDQEDSDESDDVVDMSEISFDHTEPVFSAKFSPNGQLVVTGGQNEKAIVWDAKSGQIVFECVGANESIAETVFNHDGTYVACGDLDGKVMVWKVSTKAVHEEYSTDSEITWMFWHPLANILFAGCKSGNTYMWRLPMVNVKILISSGVSTQCGVLLPDGKRLAVGYDNVSVAIWDLKTAKILHKYENTGEGPLSRVISIDAYSDNNLIAAGIDDGETGQGFVVFIKANTGTEVARFPTEEGIPEAVKFGTGCVSGILAIAYNNRICFWDVARQAVRKTVTITEPISRMVWSSEGIVYTAGLSRGDIHAVDARRGVIVKTLTGHKDSLLDISISKDSQFIVTASDDKTVKVFKITTVE